MRTLSFIFTVFIIAGLTFSWSTPQVTGEEYYQSDPNREILKNAVVGAGVGAVASGASGGSAGKGALIGAGTNVIGNALVDTLTSPPRTQTQTQYVQQPQVQYVQRSSERVYVTEDSTPSATGRGGCGKSR